MSDSTSTPRRMTPGDDMHLTLLMTPHGLNFVTGQDRQHLLAFGRAAFEAGKVAAAAQQAVEVTDDMALAFHQALTDGALGADDLDDIKTGLRAALSHVQPLQKTVAAQQGVQPVLGWVHKLVDGKIGSHFYKYEPHCDNAVRDNGGEKIAVVAATHPDTQGLDAQIPIPWISVYQQLPAWTDDHSIRVLALTAYDDFSGVQVHDIKASDFYQYDEERGMGTEVTNVCTHWVYRDAVLPGVAATTPTPQGLDADMFWDADDPERCESSINNVVVEVGSCRGLKVGDIVTIQRAARLPDLEVRVTQVPDAEGNGDLEWDVIDAAQAKEHTA